MQSEEKEGYDHEDFVNEDRSKTATFCCTICKKVAREPTETQPCGHLFCRRCLEQYLSANRPTCPQCQSAVESKNMSAFIKREILQLRVKCKNKKHGCEWTGELNGLNDHSSKCGFALLRCKYCAAEEYIKKHESQHWDECVEYPLDCKYCQEKVLRKQMEKHLNELCANVPISCPHHCGSKNGGANGNANANGNDNGNDNDNGHEPQFLRQHLTQHLTTCPMVVVACPFERLGCTANKTSSATLRRKDLKQHMHDLRWRHFELKQAYLQRLVLSTELIRVNTSAKGGEISGIYERVWKSPWEGRPTFRCQHNDGASIILFDAANKRWVILARDEVVAQRFGMFPSPIVDEEEEEVEDVDIDIGIDINIDADVKVDAGQPDREKEVEASNIDPIPRGVQDIDEKKDEPHIQGNHVASVSNNQTDNNKDKDNNKNKKKDKDKDNDEKKLELEKEYRRTKKWHVIGAPKSKIEFVGCTQSELDLEWKLLEMIAKHDSSKKNRTRGNSENESTGVFCKCGKELIRTSIDSIYTGLATVTCNVCERQIPPMEEVLHCPTNSNLAHLQGYDLCESCSEARRQSQQITKRVQCACGKQMQALLANNCYPFSSGVSCNKCQNVVYGNIAVFHCLDVKSSYHPKGYDYCVKCADAISNAYTTRRIWPF